ncbi:MAG: peptide ABC transporter substrate-binding protein [Rhodospirillales bacterium]|nr:peptide ABC transporter substrate-binding protein [Rhodospirillales bacterium]MDH3917500.1 peptide ABC transporter substrate-binding protein [Rhodospirillales bacterium]MDH3968239.1 peptide ABC transporter substrate-binding protein [Rhodospirillales bacterium]
MRFLLASLVLALGIVTTPAHAGGAGELKIGITQFPSTLNPNIDAMLAKSYVLAMARRPITAYDQDWTLICLLCTELPTIENGLAVRETTPDGKPGIAVTYELHPEATWGDGTPVTTDDVIFTWEVGRHPLSGVSSIEAYRRILSIDRIDDKRFTAHVDRVTFDYNASASFDLLPAHVERPIFEAGPGEYRNRTTFDADPANPGLYFGPYRIVEVVSGSHIALEPNPTWYGQAPAFDRIVVRVIENTAALEANLLSGGIDMIAGELGLTIDQALAFEKRHGARFDISYKPGLIYEHIDLNLDNPLLKDIRVRRALIHALDREVLNQQLFAGRQPVAHASVSPLDWVHTDEIRTYPYDPEAAARLLDEAGWNVMKGGLRHNQAGERLTLEIMTTAGNRTRELVEQVLQSQWREVGIDARIRNEPARVFFGETVRKRKFPHMAMFAWISSPESVPRTTLHSNEIPSEANNWAGQNNTGYKSAEMDGLIDAIETELDRDKRARLWHRLQRLYTEDLPVIPLYWRANPYVLPKWLKGLRPTGHQFTTTLWVEEWRRGDR